VLVPTLLLAGIGTASKTQKRLLGVFPAGFGYRAEEGQKEGKRAVDSASTGMQASVNISLSLSSLLSSKPVSV